MTYFRSSQQISPVYKRLPAEEDVELVAKNREDFAKNIHRRECDIDLGICDAFYLMGYVLRTVSAAGLKL